MIWEVQLVDTHVYARGRGNNDVLRRIYRIDEDCDVNCESNQRRRCFTKRVYRP